MCCMPLIISTTGGDIQHPSWAEGPETGHRHSLSRAKLWRWENNFSFSSGYVLPNIICIQFALSTKREYCWLIFYLVSIFQQSCCSAQCFSNLYWCVSLLGPGCGILYFSLFNFARFLLVHSSRVPLALRLCYTVYQPPSSPSLVSSTNLKINFLSSSRLFINILNSIGSRVNFWRTYYLQQTRCWAITATLWVWWPSLFSTICLSVCSACTSLAYR